MWETFKKILWQTESKDAEAKQIAKHLSKVLLNRWAGIDALYPDFKEKAERLKKIMETFGHPILLGDTFRSCQKQNEYYAQGRTTPGSIITNAKGLQSYHQYGLAFDFQFVVWQYRPPKGVMDKLVKEAKNLGMVWGGSWNDSFHLEFHPTFSWRELEPYFL